MRYTHCTHTHTHIRKSTSTNFFIDASGNCGYTRNPMTLWSDSELFDRVPFCFTRAHTEHWYYSKNLSFRIQVISTSIYLQWTHTYIQALLFSLASSSSFAALKFRTLQSYFLGQVNNHLLFFIIAKENMAKWERYKGNTAKFYLAARTASRADETRACNLNMSAFRHEKNSSRNNFVW